jgi:hypothetical protein
VYLLLVIATSLNKGVEARPIVFDAAQRQLENLNRRYRPPRDERRPGRLPK